MRRATDSNLVEPWSHVGCLVWQTNAFGAAMPHLTSDLETECLLAFPSLPHLQPTQALSLSTASDSPDKELHSPWKTSRTGTLF